jgi:hypothetical protein
MGLFRGKSRFRNVGIPRKILRKMIFIAKYCTKNGLQVNYTRWLCFCHVPAFCDSMPHYEIALIFGKSMLKSVFQVPKL